MNGFYKKLMDWLTGPFTKKVQSFVANPYIRALQSCFSITLPMILAGSVATLIGDLRNWLPWLPDLSIVNSLTFGLLSIFMAFVIPYSIMEYKHFQKQKMITGFTGIAVLFALCNPQYVDGNIVINSGYLGTSGMTVAIVFGLLIGWLFSKYFQHGLISKNSELPPAVIVWFESIIPIFVVVLLCSIVSKYVNFYTLLETVFTPLSKIGNTYVGFVLFYIIMALCYCLGLSAWAIWPIVGTLCISNIAANAAAVAAGQPAPYILTDETIFMGWCCIGGLGATLPLNVMMLRSKSKTIKAIGRSASVPSLFNINEPVMYGLPIVLNPYMMIGYMIVSFVIPTITYIALKAGMVPVPAKGYLMNYIPQPISTIMVSPAVSSVILWVLLWIIAYVIYKPFFKAYENEKIIGE